MKQQFQHTKLVSLLFLAVILMFLFGFALVPIYNSLCKVLGVNGKISGRAAPYILQHTDKNRLVTVEFLATQNSTLPWKFYSTVKKTQIHPGEITKLSFYAENQSNHRMVVQAIPSVTPGIAAKYVKKTECFCFAQQSLNPHESMEMPLIFHLDTDLPREVHTLTLSYTLYDVTDRAK